MPFFNLFSPKAETLPDDGDQTETNELANANDASDDESNELIGARNHHKLKSLLESESASYAQKACKIQRMIRLVEAQDQKNLEVGKLIEGKDGHIKHLEEQILTLKRDDAQKTKTIRAMESKLQLFQPLANENASLKFKVTSLTTTIDCMTASLEEKDAAICELRAEVQSLQEQEATYQHTVLDLTDRLEQEQNTVDELKDRVLALEERVEELEEENSTYKAARTLFIQSTMVPTREITTGPSNQTNSFSTPRTVASSTPAASSSKKRKLCDTK